MASNVFVGGKGLFTAWDPASALRAHPPPTWVAVMPDKITPELANQFKQAGIQLVIWEPMASQAGVDAVKQYGAVGYIAQAETPAELAAAQQYGSQVTVPKALVSNNFMSSYPPGWIAMPEAYTNNNPNATADQVTRDARARGAQVVVPVIGLGFVDTPGGQQMSAAQYQNGLNAAGQAGAAGSAAYIAEQTSDQDLNTYTSGATPSGSGQPQQSAPTPPEPSPAPTNTAPAPAPAPAPKPAVPHYGAPVTASPAAATPAPGPVSPVVGSPVPSHVQPYPTYDPAQPGRQTAPGGMLPADGPSGGNKVGWLPSSQVQHAIALAQSQQALGFAPETRHPLDPMGQIPPRPQTSYYLETPRAAHPFDASLLGTTEVARTAQKPMPQPPLTQETSQAVPKSLYLNPQAIHQFLGLPYVTQGQPPRPPYLYRYGGY